MADINDVESIVPVEEIEQELNAITKNVEQALRRINQFGNGINQNLSKGLDSAARPLKAMRANARILKTTLDAVTASLTTFEQKQQMAVSAANRRFEQSGSNYGKQATRIRRAQRLITDAQMAIEQGSAKAVATTQKAGTTAAAVFNTYQVGFRKLQQTLATNDSLTGEQAQKAQQYLNVQARELASLKLRYDELTVAEHKAAQAAREQAKQAAASLALRNRQIDASNALRARTDAVAAGGRRLDTLRAERTEIRRRYALGVTSEESPQVLEQYSRRLAQISTEIDAVTEARRKSREEATKLRQEQRRQIREDARLARAAATRQAREEAAVASGNRVRALRAERTRVEGDRTAERLGSNAPGKIAAYSTRLAEIETELQGIADARRKTREDATRLRQEQRRQDQAERAAVARQARVEAAAASGNQVRALRAERTKLSGDVTAERLNGNDPAKLAAYSARLNEIETKLQAINAAKKETAAADRAFGRGEQLRLRAALTTDQLEKTKLLAKATRAELDAELMGNKRLIPALEAKQAEYDALLKKVQQLQAQQRAEGRAQPMTLGQRFANQARIFANYAVMGAGLGAAYKGINQLTGLDENLRNLQAITHSTDAAITGLNTRVLKLAAVSKFAAPQLANAGTILGQAGLSARQTGQALKGVDVLAQGAGATLEQSVDLITSTMGAFNMRAEESVDIANTFTAALNGSKLQMQQLGTAFQYAAAPAAQLGMSYQELTAIMMGMAQAGVRSGSIIGTGIRQVLNQLAAMRPKLAAILHDLKIAPEEVDVGARGLIPVLQTLQEKGFGVSEAFKAFGTRGAGAFAIMANQAGNLEGFEKSIMNTDAATEAADTQMRSFTNTARAFGNTVVEVAASGVQPMLRGLQQLMSAGRGVVEIFAHTGAAGRVLANALALAAGAKAVQYIARLLSFGKAAEVAGAGTITLRAALIGAATGANTFGTAMKAAWAAIGPWGIALAAASVAFEVFEHNSAAAAASQQELAESVDQAQGKYQAAKTSYTSASEAVQRLLTRQNELRNSTPELELEASRLRERFGGLGLSIDDLGGSYDKLLSKMRAVEVEAKQATRGALSDLLAKNMTLNGSYVQQLENLRGNYASLAQYNEHTNAPVAASSALGAGINRLAETRTRSLTVADLPTLRAARLELSRREQSGPLPNDFLKATATRLDKMIALLAKLQRGDKLVKNLQERQQGFDWADTKQGRAVTSQLDAFIARTKSTSPKDRTYSLPQARTPKQIAAVGDRITTWTTNFRKQVANLPKPAQEYLRPQLNTLATQAGKALLGQSDAGGTLIGQAGTTAQYDLRSLTARVANLKWSAENSPDAAIRKAARDRIVQLYTQETQAQIAKLKASKAFRALPAGEQAGAIGNVTEQIRNQKELTLKQIDASMNKMAAKAIKARSKALLSEITRDFLSLDTHGHKSSYGEAKRALASAQQNLNAWRQTKLAALGNNPDPNEVAQINAQAEVLQGRINSKRGTLGSRPVDNWSDFLEQRRMQYQMGGTGDDSLNATMFKALGGATDTLQNGLGGALDDILQKTKSVGDAFTQLGQSITQSIMKILTDQMAREFLGLLFGGSTSGGASGGGGLLAAAGGAAAGGAAAGGASGGGSGSNSGGLIGRATDWIQNQLKPTSDTSTETGTGTVSRSSDELQVVPGGSKATASLASKGMSKLMDKMFPDQSKQQSGQQQSGKQQSSGGTDNTGENVLMGGIAGGLLGSALGSAIGGKKTRKWMGIAGGLLGGISGLYFAGGGSVAAHSMGEVIQGPIQNRDSVWKVVHPGGFVLNRQGVQSMAGGGAVLAKTMPGEMYFNPEEVKAIGVQNLRRLNMGLAGGGSVGDTVDLSGVSSAASRAGSAPSGKASQGKTHSTMATNVYVVAPDQEPQLTPNDVVVNVADNIRQNGSIKTLVKQIIQENQYG